MPQPVLELLASEDRAKVLPSPPKEPRNSRYDEVWSMACAMSTFTSAARGRDVRQLYARYSKPG